MKNIELLTKKYHELKGICASLIAIERLAIRKLTEFVAKYGILSINTDGVPHTVTDLSDDEAPSKQVMQVRYDKKSEGLIFTTVDGQDITHYAIDDLSYLLDDLSQECLEYAETEDS